MVDGRWDGILDIGCWILEKGVDLGGEEDLLVLLLSLMSDRFLLCLLKWIWIWICLGLR